MDETETFADVIAAVQRGDREAFSRLEAVCREHLYTALKYNDDDYQEALNSDLGNRYRKVYRWLPHSIAPPVLANLNHLTSNTISLQQKIRYKDDSEEIGNTITCEQSRCRLDLIEDATWTEDETTTKKYKRRERKIAIPRSGFGEEYQSWKRYKSAAAS